MKSSVSEFSSTSTTSSSPLAASFGEGSPHASDEERRSRERTLKRTPLEVDKCQRAPAKTPVFMDNLLGGDHLTISVLSRLEPFQRRAIPWRPSFLASFLGPLGRTSCSRRHRLRLLTEARAW